MRSQPRSIQHIALHTVAARMINRAHLGRDDNMPIFFAAVQTP